jgi:hypothetical protein
MAGRKPRKNPFGAPDDDPPEPEWKPGQFVHGMYSEHAIRERSEAIGKAFLSDPHCPPHIRLTTFMAEFASWTRREALASLALDYAERKLYEEGLEGLFGLKPGVMRAPAEILSGSEDGASRARSKLGINPASYARIMATVNFSQTSAADQVRQMDAAGAEIVARRSLESGDAA